MVGDFLVPGLQPLRPHELTSQGTDGPPGSSEAQAEVPCPSPLHTGGLVFWFPSQALGLASRASDLVQDATGFWCLVVAAPWECPSYFQSE